MEIFLEIPVFITKNSDNVRTPAEWQSAGVLCFGVQSDFTVQ